MEELSLLAEEKFSLSRVKNVLFNKVIASRFKKRGKSWSKRGALALLKIKETILNNQWDEWGEKGREQDIKISKFNPPLPASYFKKEAESSPLIEVTIPALSGPD